MTHRDAALLVTGILGSEKLTGAPKTALAYSKWTFLANGGDLAFPDSMRTVLPELSKMAPKHNLVDAFGAEPRFVDALGSQHSFIDAFGALLAAGADGSLAKLLESPEDRGTWVHVTVHFPMPQAEISIRADETAGGAVLQYVATTAPRLFGRAPPTPPKRIKRIFSDLGILQKGDMSGSRAISHRTILGLGAALGEDG